ncbi:MAG: alpha-galactosidase [Ruminococcaceae bacterium]|nr:alpha-galactosidase [Oscillospiraceae bacterium]
MAVYFNEENKHFYLEGKDYSYVFRINRIGFAEHLYFGSRIGREDMAYMELVGSGSAYAQMPNERNQCYSFYNPELCFYGTGDYREPTFMVKNPGGDRLCRLHYTGHEILSQKPRIKNMPSLSGEETLIIHLEDELSKFAADLYYTVYEDSPILARRIVYKNNSDNDLVLDRAYSFALAIPNKEFDILTLRGAWGAERQMQYCNMHRGVVSIDSKRCTSSAILNPFIAAVSKGANEEYGEVFAVNLVYSSSFVLKSDRNADGKAMLCGGINDFDFEWHLAPGEELEAPEAVIAYSNEGLGKMSRAYHDVYRKHLINPRYVNAERPVVINNWEGTYFNFNSEKLIEMAKAVKGLGIDTFVLDDGWFGHRDEDSSSLGDWFVYEKKLPGGLKPVIDAIHENGMKFGLWFEPEMISEDSELYRAHPDYAIGVPGRDRCKSRRQYMLDLTRKDVRDHIVDAVNKVLSENEIDYVKWDYNRNVTDNYSLSLPPERQKEFAHRYALGVYDIMERIVNGNPDIFFEGCAGGGARFDPAILYYFPQIWTSDNTDAEERTKIQYGTSICYPLSTMSCHVSAVPNHQTRRCCHMKTRADIAHLGATGYELDPTLFTDEDKDAVKAQISAYRELSRLILDCDLYRTENPFEGNFFGFNLVSKDKSESVFTCYRRLNGEETVKLVYPGGLDPEKKYYIPERNVTLSGSTIMNAGLEPYFPHHDFATDVIHFKEVK